MADKSSKKIDMTVRLGTIIVLLASSLFFFPREKSLEYAYEVHQITTEEIIAPFDFPILKTKGELEKDRAEALDEIYPLFIRKDDLMLVQLDQMDRFFEVLINTREAKTAYGKNLATKVLSRSIIDSALINRLKADSLKLFDLVEIANRDFGFDLSKKRWNFLTDPTRQSFGGVDVLQTFRANVERIARDLFREGVLDIPLDEIQKQQIAVLEKGEEILGDKGYYMSHSDVTVQAEIRLKASLGVEEGDEVEIGIGILRKFIKPNIIYDVATTEGREREAIAKVPISRDIVRLNERIVDRNERVTPLIKQKLESLYSEKARRGTAEGGIVTLLPQVGRVLLVSVILFFFGAFIVAYRPQIYKDNRMILLIGFIFLSHLAFSSLVIYRLGLSEYLIPIVIASMVLTILVDARIAFIGTATLALLIGVILGNKLDFVIVSIFAGTASIFSVTRLRTRSQLFKSFVYVSFAYILAITAVEILKFSSLDVLLESYKWAIGNALLSPIIVYGIIGFLEIAFGITTDLTLLEQSDTNRPLLKQLAIKASGTYTHSLASGNLAEEAADAIGANSLLARVGSYYHDIGKMNKPEYFAENQRGADNRHEMLRPNLSALILSSHVRDGIELAKKHKVPEAIIQFITSHHGTMRMEYFYKKAVDAAGDDGVVNEMDFRYPGPKPVTKESGIVMLCEGIEAATRSIKEKTVNRIRDMVDYIVKSRLNDGQLDECDLTLAEIGKMKKAILPILIGMYHVRIEYPEDEEESKEEDKSRQDKEESGMSPAKGEKIGQVDGPDT